MKSILFMMYDMHCGGVEKSLISLLNEMDNTKYSVTLLLLNRQGEYIDDIPSWVEIKTLNIPLDVKYEILYGNRVAIKKLFANKEYIKFTKKLYNVIYNKFLRKKRASKQILANLDKTLAPHNQNYDLAIDYQGLGSGLFSTFYVANKVIAKNKVTWIHQDVSIIRENVLWVNEYYDKYNKIFSVSKQAEQKFLELFSNCKEKSDVLYNILPVENILELSNEKVSFPNYNQKTCILSVGRLSYQKGYDIAFSAIKKLIHDQYEFKYFIIGEGEKRKELENLIKQYGLSDVIILLGFIKNPYPYMEACDIYLQPSRFEGFCLTLGEAKIFNKPIITTDFAGSREQIKNGETGNIINCNEKEMYEALKDMFDDNSMRSKLSLNLKERGKETVNIEKLYKLIQ